VTGKNGRILLYRPKPTAGCSAYGRREEYCWIINCIFENVQFPLFTIHIHLQQIMLNKILNI
jgi:hypothetical protein